MLRRAQVLFRIILSTILVLGLPLSTFQMAEARTDCAERMQGDSHTQYGDFFEGHIALTKNAIAAGSPHHVMPTVSQQAFDCFSECLEDCYDNFSVFVAPTEPSSSKKCILASSTDQYRSQANAIGYLHPPWAIAFPQSTILRTMRWRL